MQCRTCGTRIADRAIICFRCGTPTADPAIRPAPAGRAAPASPGIRVPLTASLLAAVIFGVGYYLGDWVRGLIVAIAVDGVITGWWAWRLAARARRSGVD